jgi:asparagine synthase (glutamine-hydrolysing)
MTRTILGFFHRDGGPVSGQGLDAMWPKWVVSGSNNDVIWKEGPITFGAIQPSPVKCTRPQVLNPWVDPRSGLVIVSDARLDARQELIEKLGITDNRVSSFTDSELILSAFRAWGRDCVAHLLGQFSFVICDPRKHTLFCARDHIGSRPFYYHLSRDLFVFASSAYSVAAHVSVRAPINRSRVGDFLEGSLERINDTCSFFQNVVRLPPAHWMEVSSDRIVTRRYWGLDPDRQLELSSDEEYADSFEEILQKSIQDGMSGHGQVASMLSGGVDSSTIVGIARDTLAKSNKAPLKTFSGISDVAADGLPCRETYFVNSVIGHGGLEATRLSPSSVSEFQPELSNAVQFVEDPFDFASTMSRLIFMLARQEGCLAVFDGVDGDVVASLPSNYPLYLLRSGKFGSAHHELREQYKNYFRRTLSPVKVGWFFCRGLLPIPLAARHFRAKLRRAVSSRESLKESFLSPGLAAEIKLEDRFAEYEALSNVGFKSSLRQAHIDRVITPDLTAGVERYARIATSAGVENRQPLLDRRVIEFCVSLPWDQKCRDGWSKFALRNVASRFVPEEVAWRPGWEEIAGNFHLALKELTARSDAETMLEYGESLREYIDWPRVREYALGRLDGSMSYSFAADRAGAFINWHRHVATNSKPSVQ